MRVIGIDPGLKCTGWGVISVERGNLSFIASGIVCSDMRLDFASRLLSLYEGIESAIINWAPCEAAVEQAFVNVNPASSIKLAQARAVVVLAVARGGLPVSEYAPNVIKQSVVGAGHAKKEQVSFMLHALFPGDQFAGEHSIDALATAICHVHHRCSMGFQCRRK